MANPDVINALAGLAEKSPAAVLRRQKPDLVAFAQGSYEALLEPDSPGAFTLLERHAAAYRIGLLTDFDTVAGRHLARLQELAAESVVLTALADLDSTAALPPRLAAMVAHTDRVTLRPGAATKADIAALAEAGLTPTEIVSLGQLIGFIAYQVRAIAVARAFGESS